MPVHIVMEQPHARHLVGLRRGIATLLGVGLILVSWATLPVLAYLLYGWFHHHYHHLSSSSVGKGTAVAYLGLVIALLVVPWFVGLRLVRASRRLVLFLRRFGYTDATDALTFAALTTIGRSWRLVTLDDAAVAPVGISRGMAKFAAAGEFSWVWFGRARKRLGSLTRLALGVGLVGMAVVAGHTYHRHHSELKMVEASVGYHHQAAHVGDAESFRIFLIVAIVAVAAAVVFAVVALLLMPVFRPLHRFSGTLQRAEQAKVTRVVSTQDVLKVAGAVRDQARRVFSPRLMVLNVDSAVWQKTVQTVANLASVVLIDVSVLTENLLWEVAEVVEDPSTACVLVGHAEGLRALDVIDTPLEQRLVELLDGRTILAYETTEQGMTRFANALRAALEAAVSRRR
jgi:hypothetical protein